MKRRIKTILRSLVCTLVCVSLFVMASVPVGADFTTKHNSSGASGFPSILQDGNTTIGAIDISLLPESDYPFLEEFRDELKNGFKRYFVFIGYRGNDTMYFVIARYQDRYVGDGKGAMFSFNNSNYKTFYLNASKYDYMTIRWNTNKASSVQYSQPLYERDMNMYFSSSNFRQKFILPGAVRASNPSVFDSKIITQHVCPASDYSCVDVWKTARDNNYNLNFTFTPDIFAPPASSDPPASSQPPPVSSDPPTSSEPPPVSSDPPTSSSPPPVSSSPPPASSDPPPASSDPPASSSPPPVSSDPPPVSSDPPTSSSPPPVSSDLPPVSSIPSLPQEPPNVNEDLLGFRREDLSFFSNHIFGAIGTSVNVGISILFTILGIMVFLIIVKRFFD